MNKQSPKGTNLCIATPSNALLDDSRSLLGSPLQLGSTMSSCRSGCLSLQLQSLEQSDSPALPLSHRYRFSFSFRLYFMNHTRRFLAYRDWILITRCVAHFTLHWESSYALSKQPAAHCARVKMKSPLSSFCTNVQVFENIPSKCFLTF